MKRHLFQTLASLALALLLMAGTLPEGLRYGALTACAEGAALKNPVIIKDGGMESGQEVTYDCIWFGSYPQAEVIPQGEYTAVAGSCLETGDIIKDDGLYSTLQKATGWDKNGDIAIGGSRYRRIKEDDATGSQNGRAYHYQWKNDSDYHYFKYQPVKWRVLKTDGKKALLLSDKAIDDWQYDTENAGVTWEKSTIRSFLNGYGASENRQGTDFKSRENFLFQAFSPEERGGILASEVTQKDSIINTSPEAGGKDTKDKVFLLSDAEVSSTDKAASYGFAADKYCEDEARRCRSTTYAKAMGAYYRTTSTYCGNSVWWLRSPGEMPTFASAVHSYGGCYSYDLVSSYDVGVRPSLNLDLSAPVYSYAGTVCTGDGKVSEHPEGQHKHKWSSYKTIKEATVFSKGTKTRTCTLCKKQEKKTTAKLKPSIELSKTRVKLKKGKTVTIKVRKLAKGDSVKSWKSSGKETAAVDSRGKITAKKRGSAVVTVTLKSGKKAKVKVTVS